MNTVTVKRELFIVNTLNGGGDCGESTIVITDRTIIYDYMHISETLSILVTTHENITNLSPKI